MMTTDTIKSLLTDRQAVGLTILGEARDQSLVGQIAVACCIRNRLARPARFGESWRAVCLRRRQFSCWEEIGGASNYAAVLAAAERLVSGFEPDPKSAVGHCLWVADGVMRHGTPDVTGRRRSLPDAGTARLRQGARLGPAAGASLRRDWRACVLPGRMKGFRRCRFAQRCSRSYYWRSRR